MIMKTTKTLTMAAAPNTIHIGTLLESYWNPYWGNPKEKEDMTKQNDEWFKKMQEEQKKQYDEWLKRCRRSKKSSMMSGLKRWKK